jgi:hypothetical protein
MIAPLTTAMTNGILYVTTAGIASSAASGSATTVAQISNGWNNVAVKKADMDAQLPAAVEIPPVG